MNLNKITKTFMYGITIFVLIIFAGIITGILTFPLAMVSIALEGGYSMVAIFAFIISIFSLGWVFERYKVRRK